MLCSHPPMSLARVHRELGALLKSDFAVDELVQPQPRGRSFRSFVSRSISVLDLKGGSIALRKGVSHASDVHLLRLQRGAVQLTHADGSLTLHAGQFVAFGGDQALEFRHEHGIELLAVYVPASAV